MDQFESHITKHNEICLSLYYYLGSDNSIYLMERQIYIGAAVLYRVKMRLDTIDVTKEKAPLKILEISKIC